ncbi:uncharacterized protein LOC111256504 [Setaria italica]|uniref:uncharacterized protein LOC111256504 n=1 Tax=Setaria italica TaxID=4555 RepID=UPI000BE5150A|nr:uncharacterized protein LOC111256504 [Setaria italica]
MACHLVAAHGGLVLLRLDSVVLDSTEKHPTPYKAVIHDYFVYYIPAGPDPRRSPPPPERRPSLKRLPAYAEYSSIVDKPVLFPFETQSVGLCRRGEEEEFALAYLGIHRTGKSAGANPARSSTAACASPEMAIS